MSIDVITLDQTVKHPRNVEDSYIWLYDLKLIFNQVRVARAP